MGVVSKVWQFVQGGAPSKFLGEFPLVKDEFQDADTVQEPRQGYSSYTLLKLNYN